MEHPDWALKHRTRGVELRKIGDKYYLYKVRNIWDKERKRPRKITEKFLGRVTEEGITKPRHERISESLEHISVKEFGAARFIEESSKEIFASVKDVFGISWKELCAFAAARLMFASPMKNVQYHYAGSYLSEFIKGAKLSPKALGSLVHSTGMERERIKVFMSEYVEQGKDAVIDVTHIFSHSEGIITAALGHNSEHEYTPQINLFLIYSPERMQPMFYRMLTGSVPDVSSLVTTLEEAEISDATLIGDKGFYSLPNVAELEGKGMRYILPVKRNLGAIDYSPLRTAGKSGFDGYIMFEKRAIWHYSRKLEGRRCITFLDGRLKTEEERDFLARVDSGKAGIADFHENEHAFGTITVVTNTDTHPKRIFELLKSRIEIEAVFDVFKNVLNADRSYMRNDASLEGWMFVNFIALLMYYRIYAMLLSRSMLDKYSPKDVLMHLSRVFMLKIGDKWKVSEIPRKSRIVISKLGIEDRMKDVT